MRKIFAIGTLLLSSAAVLVTPAAALDRNDYGYRAPQSSQVHETAQVHAERLRHERLERERLDRERRAREQVRYHADRDGYGSR